MTAPAVEHPVGPRGRVQLVEALAAARERLRHYQPQYAVTVTIGGHLRTLYRAQPKQDVLHAARAPNILFGGAAGGAKSHGLRWDAIIKCLRVPGLKALFLRRSYPELKRTHLQRIELELPNELATLNRADHLVTFRTGSLIQFGHCQDIKALNSYLSTEWDVIYVDEGSTFLPLMLRMLQTRARSTIKGVVPQFIIASNPGGDAHLYLLQRFIEKAVPEDEDPDGEYEPDDYLFIPSLLTDNAYIQDDYLKRLLSLPAPEQDAYLYGKWSAFAGQFFRDWSPEHHAKKVPKIPDWWELEAGMDWGYSPDPGVVLLGAFDEFGRVHLIRELLFRESTAAEVARQMADAFPEAMVREVTVHGDTQMWAKQPETAVSIADAINDELAELGCKMTLVKANKDRINGWMRVRQFLAFRRDPLPVKGAPVRIVPWLTVAQPDVQTGYGCPNLIAALPAQAFDDRPTHTGDMKPSATDHPCDAARYLLMAREPLSEIPIEERPGKAHHEVVHDRNRKLLERLAAAAVSAHPELASMPAVVATDALEAVRESPDPTGGDVSGFYH